MLLSVYYFLIYLILIYNTVKMGNSELTINLDYTILKNQKHSPFLVRSPEGLRGNRSGGVGRFVYCGEGGMGMSRFVQMSKKPINLHVSNHLVPFGWALRAI